jgi:hypothetical protein
LSRFRESGLLVFLPALVKVVGLEFDSRAAARTKHMQVLRAMVQLKASCLPLPATL